MRRVQRYKGRVILNVITSQYQAEGMSEKARASVIFDKYHANPVLPYITITKGIDNVKRKGNPYIYTLNDLCG